MSDTLPTLDEILRADDERLVRMYEGNPGAQEFVRRHPDYVRREWYSQPSPEAIEREEETLP